MEEQKLELKVENLTLGELTTNALKIKEEIKNKLEDYKAENYDINSIDKAKEQAEEYGHTFLREITFLAVHGFYHLLGYDHMNEEEEKVMFQKQEEVLNECEIKREK